MLYLLCISNVGRIWNRCVISTFAVCNRIFYCHYYCLGQIFH